MHKARRDRDVGVARDGRSARSVPAKEVIAVDEIGSPRRTDGRGNQRIEFVFPEHSVDAVAPGCGKRDLARLPVGFVSQRPFCLGLQKQLLTKIRHLQCALPFVETYHLRESSWRARAPGQISVQSILEFIE